MGLGKELKISDVCREALLRKGSYHNYMFLVVQMKDSLDAPMVNTKVVILNAV